jgi:hypothetical protein
MGFTRGFTGSERVMGNPEVEQGGGGLKTDWTEPFRDRSAYGSGFDSVLSWTGTACQGACGTQPVSLPVPVCQEAGAANALESVGETCSKKRLINSSPDGATTFYPTD